MGRGIFSTLWSDVGQFYTSCGPLGGEEGGWVIRDPISTVWKVEGARNLELSRGSWTWLTHEEVAELWTAEGLRMKQDMARSSPCTVAFTYLPGSGLETFQRLDIMAYIKNEDPPLDTWGIVSEDGTAFAAWSVDVQPLAMVVTRLRATETQFEVLLPRLIEVAARHGMEKVEVWNLAQELRQCAERTRGKESERGEHLPHVYWYGEERPEDVSWMFNER
jgi:hypothetical protein